MRTTVTSFADQRIQVISQRVMTTRNLSGIIERYNLYPELRRKQSINAAVEEMRKAINLEMISADVVDPRGGSAQKATIAFSLSYESDSPVLAQKVVNDLVSLFLNENIEQRQAAVDEATAFLGGEAKKLGEQIAALEGQLAAFKEQHRDNLPEFAAHQPRAHGPHRGAPARQRPGRTDPCGAADLSGIGARPAQPGARPGREPPGPRAGLRRTGSGSWRRATWASRLATCRPIRTASRCNRKLSRYASRSGNPTPPPRRADFRS